MPAGACRALVAALVVLPLAPPALALDPSLPLRRFVHDRWDTRDGLPEGAVFAILEDRDGYVWLGTQFGVVRFDGVRFRLFDEGELGLKQYSFARSLLATEDGSVWAALVGGVARYHDGRFDFFDEAQGLQHPFVYAIAPGPERSLWVGTGGSGVWRLQDGRFSRHPAYAQPGLPAQVNDLATDRDGTLWVATGDGVVALGPTARRFGRADGLGSATANKLLVDHGGRLWVGTRAGLSRWDGSRFRTWTVRDGLSSDDVTALLEDHDGTLWVGTRTAGLDRRSGERFEPAVDRLSAEEGVFALAEDRDGALWLGTERGLERYRVPAFTTYGRPDGLRDERLLNVASRSAGGVYVLDGSGAVLVFERDRARVLAPAGSIPGSGMLGMVEGRDGSLWVGGSQLLRLRGGRWERFSRSGGEFTVLLPDADRGLVVAQTDGDGRSSLSRFEDGLFTPMATGVPLVHVQRLLRDREGRLWIATGGAGLVRLDGDRPRVFGTKDGLPHAVVYGLVEDDHGTLWIGTRGGLARLRDDRITSLASFEELPHRSPLHLHLDRRRRLWITADDGVYRVRLDDLDALAEGRSRRAAVMRFGTADGLRSLEISWRCSGQAATPDGRLWYATSRGLSMVDADRAPEAPPPPRVLIEGLSAGGRPLGLADEVDVGEGRERIQIRYTAPTLSHAERLLFRSRLVGYDGDWVDERTARAASYTNLAPGSYTFRVAVRRPSGDWGGEAAELRLRILPRWYELPAARALALAGLGLSMVGFYRLRLRRLHRREAELVQKVEERTKELRDEVRERARAEDAVRTLNDELEKRVRQRTSELEETNEALEKDVAERERAEAELAAEKERLAVTLRSIADGVITTDVAGCVVLMNPVAERHTGWGSREAGGRPLSEVLRLAERFDRTPLADPLARVLGPAGPAADALAPSLLAGRDGREILVDVSAAPIHDRDSRVVGAVLVFRDVTEKTRTDERMQQAQKLEAIGALAAGIAHDFNNLLMGVFGQVDLARATLPGASPASARLESALDVLDHAKSLARQLLTFSAGGRPATEAHGLGDLLRRSVRFVLSGSTISAELDLPDDLWPCEVDAQQIRQAIDNLLLNARQAMPAGGTVRVRASNLSLPEDSPALRAGRYVEVLVSDEGPGIPEEIRDRVFDPFFTTKSSGTGLGLATVQSILSRHGGSVEFESSAGGGTTFRLRLRAAKTAPAPRSKPGSTEPRRGQGRVLVMDDEPVVLEVATAALEHLGYTVEGTADGERTIAAFDRARSEGRPFDVVILDLTVAGAMGGVETLAQLRERQPGLRAIATSGYSSDPVLAQPAAFGFSGTLPKPYTMVELAAVVDSVLRSPGRPEGA